MQPLELIEMMPALMATSVITVGLLTLGLLMQVINQVRLRKTMERLSDMEDHLVVRLMHLKNDPSEMVREVTSVSLEDLIREDLLERMETEPATDSDLLKVMKAHKEIEL